MPENATNAINAFSSSATSATAAVTALTGATSGLSSVMDKFINLPGSANIMKFGDASAELARTMGLATAAVRDLNREAERMAEQTKRYSTRELQDMIFGMQRARSEIASSTAESIKLADALSQRLGKGAGEAAATITRMRDAMPELDVAIENGVIGMREYHEAYVKFGREGAAALMHAREGMRGLSEDSTDSLRKYSINAQETNKKVEDSFLKLGKATKTVFPGFSPEAGSTLKMIAEMAAQYGVLYFAISKVGGAFKTTAVGSALGKAGASIRGFFGGKKPASVANKIPGVGGLGGLGLPGAGVPVDVRIVADMTGGRGMGGMGGGGDGAGAGGRGLRRTAEQARADSMTAAIERANAGSRNRIISGRSMQNALARLEDQRLGWTGRLGRGIRRAPGAIWGGIRGAPGALRRGANRFRPGAGTGMAMMAGGMILENMQFEDPNSGMAKTAKAASPILEYGGAGAMTGNPYLALAGVIAGSGKSIYESIINRGGGPADLAKAAENARVTPKQAMLSAEGQLRMDLRTMAGEKLGQPTLDARDAAGRPLPGAMGSRKTDEYLEKLMKSTEAAMKRAEDPSLAGTDKIRAEHYANMMAMELEKTRGARERRIEAAYLPAEAKAGFAEQRLQVTMGRGGLPTEKEVKATAAAYNEQLASAEKLAEERKKTYDMELKTAEGPSATTISRYKESLALVESIKMKTIALHDVEIKRAMQSASIIESQNKLYMQQFGYLTGNIGVEGQIAQKRKDAENIEARLAVRDKEKAKMMDEIATLSDEQKQTRINEFDAATKVMQGDKEKLKTQAEFNERYDKTLVLQEHRLALSKEDAELAHLMKQPMVEAAVKQKEIGIYLEKARVERERMAEIAKVSGIDSEEFRDAQRRAKRAVTEAAKAADYVRRTFAEEFTSMAMGMPSGSYLMGAGPSGYAQFGPAALTSAEGGVKYSKAAGFQTREQQIEGMFGEMGGGRAGFERFIGNLNNAVDGQLEASDALKGAAKSLSDAAARNGAELAR